MPYIEDIIDALKFRRNCLDVEPMPNTDSRFFVEREIGPDGEPRVVPKEKDLKPSTTPE
jgi:hypothetical protein